MKLRTYRMFQAMIMTGLGFFLLHRFWSGQLVVYIHRRYIWMALITAIVLIALAQAIFNNRPPARTEEDGMLVQQNAPQGGQWRLLVMLLPLLMGMLIPVQALGAEAASSRQINQSLTLTAGAEGQDTILSIDPRSRSLLEWVWVFDVTEDKTTLANQPVRLEGFLLPGDELPGEQFMVARFIITCCVADATAVGIAVEPPTGSDPSQWRGWIRVEGIMQVTSQDGQESPLIKADSVHVIPEPDQPYLYQQ